jgi:hypothetical protein
VAPRYATPGRPSIGTPHDYFNALRADPSHWLSYSLRDPAQLASRQDGGYAQGPRTWPLVVTYAPSGDTDPHKQDAAKVVIAPWFPSYVLTDAVDATTTMLPIATVTGTLFGEGRIFRMESEICTAVRRVSASVVEAVRGQKGTVAVPHGAGTTVEHATNSLQNQVRLPLGTEDGHDYFFVWDGYWTDSYVGAGAFNHKAFQFSSGGSDGNAIWLEVNLSYGYDLTGCWNPAEHVAKFRFRSYNRAGGGANWSSTDGNMLGPGAIGGTPLRPSVEFCMFPNTWNRFFVRIRQRANDYDYMDAWVADETRDPVQVLADMPLSVRPTGATPNVIAKFWLEFNSSEDAYLRTDDRDLVSYVRNVAVLRDCSDITPWLVRPIP